MSQKSSGIGGGSLLFQRNDVVTQVEFVQIGVESDIDESALEIISPFVTQGEFVQTGVESALGIIGTISALPQS